MKGPRPRRSDLLGKSHTRPPPLAALARGPDEGGGGGSGASSMGGGLRLPGRRPRPVACGVAWVAAGAGGCWWAASMAAREGGGRGRRCCGGASLAAGPPWRSFGAARSALIRACVGPRRLRLAFLGDCWPDLAFGRGSGGNPWPARRPPQSRPLRRRFPSWRLWGGSSPIRLPPELRRKSALP